jgi:hypothetical protein
MRVSAGALVTVQQIWRLLRKTNPLTLSSNKNPHFKTHTMSWNENLVLDPETKNCAGEDQ